MTIDKDDVKLLSELISSSIDSKLGKNLEKVGDVVDMRVDAKLGKNLEKVGDVVDMRVDAKLGKNLEKVGSLIDTKMIDFFQTVTLPAIENILESHKIETSNGLSRLERKIDNITDMLTDKVSDHEKRIIKIEAAII